MVTQVGSLLKTVKNVEDDATRGTHSLESCIEGIDLELKVTTPTATPIYHCFTHRSTTQHHLHVMSPHLKS